jgi:hypothetical protein
MQRRSLLESYPRHDALLPFFTTTLKAEQRASLHLCRDAPFSRATQGMMPSFHFLQLFKNIPTTVSRLIARAKGFLMETRSSEK